MGGAGRDREQRWLRAHDGVTNFMSGVWELVVGVIVSVYAAHIFVLPGNVFHSMSSWHKSVNYYAHHDHDPLHPSLPVAAVVSSLRHRCAAWVTLRMFCWG